MDCSTPGFPVHHQLPQLAQTHVHRVSDNIQPSHPLSSPSPPTFNPSQHQGLLQWVGASISVSVLPMNIQDWFPLGLSGLISLQSKGLSRVFSNTTVWKHQFFSAQPSLWSNCHIRTWLLEKPQLDYTELCRQNDVPLLSTLSGFVVAFLTRSKSLLISWLQSPSAVILEPPK